MRRGPVSLCAAQDALPQQSVAPKRQQRQRGHLPGHPERPVEPRANAQDSAAQPSGAALFATAR